MTRMYRYVSNLSDRPEKLKMEEKNRDRVQLKN